MLKEKFLNYLKERLEMALPGHEVLFNNVTKENGITYEGVTVRPKSGNETVAPVLYLNKALEKINNGENIAEIVEETVNAYINEMNEASKYRKFDTESLLSFEDVADKIFAKLVNTELNTELLKDRPHVNVADLSKTYHIRIGKDASVPITNNLATKYGKTAEELDAIARENAKGTVKFGTMFEFLMGCGFDLDQATISDGNPMYVVTNKNQMFGAAMITYPEVLEKISDIFGGDYVILPSSIHEVIIIPANMMDKEDIYDMVKSVNETCVAQSDFLSDNVYYYNSKGKKIDFFK